MFVTPAKAGAQGNRSDHWGLWIPDFAGMTKEAHRRGLDALAGAEEVNRTLCKPSASFCGKSLARSAAARIKLRFFDPNPGARGSAGCRQQNLPVPVEKLDQ